ncbi:hypothetical protein OOU_Y34scaffold00666g82 [Pyricularia oryzae Y34]|uniref:Uncharacterized protein n=3 Tax=Pyricularia oryzae TaxID=318829 RepID=Q2KG85_PYRO7|nr:hypothetical protein MGCH7_ch7g450 [Pyricularia oryzae 70-15]ELQ36221.1 hypothetical protein OOU_Y34scaffold00666g82 [Pyricularia oryzae Y34]
MRHTVYTVPDRKPPWSPFRQLTGTQGGTGNACVGAVCFYFRVSDRSSELKIGSKFGAKAMVSSDNGVFFHYYPLRTLYELSVFQAELRDARVQHVPPPSESRVQSNHGQRMNTLSFATFYHGWNL